MIKELFKLGERIALALENIELAIRNEEGINRKLEEEELKNFNIKMLETDPSEILANDLQSELTREKEFESRGQFWQEDNKELREDEL